jgi:predicted DNA-binding protein (UPF0251 family)
MNNLVELYKAIRLNYRRVTPLYDKIEGEKMLRVLHDDFEVICKIDLEKQYTVKEVAAKLEVERDCVIRWMTRNKKPNLKYLKKGSRYFIFGKWIIEFMQK